MASENHNSIWQGECKKFVREGITVLVKYIVLRTINC
jgi:hypothetical protein